MGRTNRMRGRRTHGRGHKGGRGKGLRGGFGMSGLHKHKFKWMVKYDPDHFGAYGFVRHHDAEREPRALNLLQVQEDLGTFRERGWAVQRDGVTEVDLTKAGYTKLLSRGSVKVPLRVVVAQASQAAVQKVKQAGGEVVLQEQVEG